MNMNSLGPTVELHWKFYKTKKEGNEREDGEDVVGWGSHPSLVCRLVTDARALGGEGDAAAFCVDGTAGRGLLTATENGWETSQPFYSLPAMPVMHVMGRTVT